MKHAQAKGKVTNNDVEDLLHISDATASNYLSDLEDEGKLTQQGNGPSTHYIPSNSQSPKTPPY